MRIAYETVFQIISFTELIYRSLINSIYNSNYILVVILMAFDLYARCFENLPIQQSSDQKSFYKNAYLASQFKASICDRTQCRDGVFQVCIT